MCEKPYECLHMPANLAFLSQSNKDCSCLTIQLEAVIIEVHIYNSSAKAEN